ncbi:MAG: hypothetical protein JSR80_06780 [Verrucomicrobia bacterium]|nr:hypothetical protein [Verrucomicrobiota bacterium]
MHWLSLLNAFLFSLAGGCACIAFFYPQAAEFLPERAIELKLPPNRFALEASAYQGLGTAFALKHTPPSIRLPDLRRHLIFYGLNQRPDADAKRALIHLGLEGQQVILAAKSGEKLYLHFDPESGEGLYRFAPSGQMTKLWITPKVIKEEIYCFVGLRTEEGVEVVQPEEYAQFSLRPQPPTYRGNWHLGEIRVDNSLLARQHGRWIGEDLFLADHGGEEYAQAYGRQRIDFGEGPQAYSCFVKLGESLIWDQGRWRLPKPHQETFGLPLLHLRKQEERVLLFDLWDEAGLNHFCLSLIRSNAPQHNNATPLLRFVAAKTWSQFVLELGAERTEVSPGDWLLMDEGRFTKLISPEEIDAYVEQKRSGELVVIDGLVRKEGRPRLVCHLYNPTRTQVKTLEIPLLSEGMNAPIRQITTTNTQEEVGDDPMLALPIVVRGMIEEINE